MRKVNWNEVSDSTEFDNPTPGAYIAVIRNVEDVEAKEYIKVLWDFAEGNYKGNNQDTFERAGFWPIVLIRSYKAKALPFFKSFKTALEQSNPGYRFDEDNLSAMCGRFFGVVLGEEEYRKNDGSTGTRLYVAETRSIDAIRRGDYAVPAKKLLPAAAAPAYSAPSYGGSAAPSFDYGFSSMSEASGELPF